MVEGYEVLGKLGMGLLSAKPAERNDMYQQILPMVQQVNPNADATLTPKMVNMFALAQFQAVDANKLAAGPAQQKASETTIGKLYDQAKALEAQGATPDTSPKLKDTYAAIEAERAKSKQAMDQSKITEWTLKNKDVKEAKDEQEAKAKKWQLTSSVQRGYRQDTKPLVELNTKVMQVDATLAALAKDPDNPAAQTDLAYAAAKLFGDSKVSNMDFEVKTSTDSNIIQAYKKMQGWTSQEKIVLTPNEVTNQKAIIDIFKKNIQEKIRNYNHEYMQKSKDLDVGLTYMNPAPPEALNHLKNSPSPENQKFFEKKYGYLPSDMDGDEK